MLRKCGTAYSNSFYHWPKTNLGDYHIATNLMLSDECTYILTGKVKSYMRCRWVGMYWSGSCGTTTWFCPLIQLQQCHPKKHSDWKYMFVIPLLKIWKDTFIVLLKHIESVLRINNILYIRLRFCLWSI